MTACVDAQIEDQFIMDLKQVICTTSNRLSNENVVKMIFLFSDTLSTDEYNRLLDSTCSNGEKIIALVDHVINHKKLQPFLSTNVWAELLFLTKLYQYLKIHKSCKHQMKTHMLSGAMFFSSEFQRLLLSLGDELTDDDVRYIWIHSLDSVQPLPNQPEMLFHRMMFDKMMSGNLMLKELLLRFEALGRSDVTEKIGQYLEKKEGIIQTKRIEYDLRPTTPGGYSGLALIFNHETFNKIKHSSIRTPPLNSNLKDRNGTDKDAASLYQLWTSFGIETEVFLDECSFGFQRKLTEILRKDLSSLKIFIVCILTHGEDGIVYCSDRVPYSIQNIEAMLGESRQLAGIPKLLFIQACQGHAVQAQGECGPITKRVEMDGPNSCSANALQIPQYSDMLIGLATVPGFMSIRNIKEGTHFIQTLVEVLQTSGTKEDISMLIPEINNKVTEKWATVNNNNRENLYVVQMPTFHNQLRKGLRFRTVNVAPNS